jgi:hypothetical protein
MDVLQRGRPLYEHVCTHKSNIITHPIATNPTATTPSSSFLALCGLVAIYFLARCTARIDLVAPSAQSSKNPQNKRGPRVPIRTRR